MRGQQHSFSAHGRVFLWKCQRFWARKCLDLRGIWTPNLRIHARCSNLLSYQGRHLLSHVFEYWLGRCSYFLSKVSIWNVNCARATAFSFRHMKGCSCESVKVFETENYNNTLRPRKNGRHLPDDIFKCIFLNENVWNLLNISLKCIPKCIPKFRINNIPALVQIMAWRRLGDKPLSEPMMVGLLTHICVTRPQWDKDVWLSSWGIFQASRQSQDTSLENLWPIVMGIYRSSVNSRHKTTVMQSFDILFVVSLNKRLNKMSSCQWFSRHENHMTSLMCIKHMIAYKCLHSISQ